MDGYRACDIADDRATRRRAMKLVGNKGHVFLPVVATSGMNRAQKRLEFMAWRKTQRQRPQAAAWPRTTGVQLMSP